MRREVREVVVHMVGRGGAQNGGDATVASLAMADVAMVALRWHAQRESARKGESKCGMRGDARAFAFGGAGSGAARGVEFGRASAMEGELWCMAATQAKHRARGERR